MVADVAFYTLMHQPRRLKLAAQPIPRGASLEDLTRCLFDEHLNERYFRQVASSCYYPMARLLLEMVRQQGLRLALGFTLSFVRQAERWEPALLDLFRELVAEEGVEIVGADPYHSLHALIDLPGFTTRMRWMAESLEQTFGKRPTVTDTTEMCMSASIYDALDAAGFRGALMASDPRVLQWRSSTYPYCSADEDPYPLALDLPVRVRRGSAKISERDRQRPPYGDEKPNAHGLYLFARHQSLSDDIALRFSDSSWSEYPLYADTYARWVAGAEGDFVLLGWDCEIFGERHRPESGIFDFLRALPGEFERQGITLRTPNELIARHAEDHAYSLPLPLQPLSLLDALGLGTPVGYGPQQELLHLMRDVYNRAKLTENPELIDLAIWLMQADHFHLLQWPGPQLSSSVTPPEWQRLGISGVLNERKQLYLNVLHALAPYLPARLLRQAGQQADAQPAHRQESVPEPQKAEEAPRKATIRRSKSVVEQPEVSKTTPAKATRRTKASTELEVSDEPPAKATRRKSASASVEANPKPPIATRRKKAAEEPEDARKPPARSTRRKNTPKEPEIDQEVPSKVVRIKDLEAVIAARRRSM